MRRRRRRRPSSAPLDRPSVERSTSVACVDGAPCRCSSRADRSPGALPRSVAMPDAPRFPKLSEHPDATALHERGGRAFVSLSLRPALVAALADARPGPADGHRRRRRPPRPRAGRRRARLAARRGLVRFYPSRGVTYESHLTPPAHLTGLRVAALDALDARPTPGRRSSAPSRCREKVPDPALRPHSLHDRQGRPGRPRRARRATSSARATSASSRSRTAGSSPCAAASSTSSRPRRSAPSASSCSTSRSSRCAGSPPSPSARWATRTRSRSRPAAELAPEHRDVDDIMDLPLESLPRAARPDPGRTRRSSSPPRRTSSRACATTGRTSAPPSTTRRPGHLYVKPRPRPRRRSTSARRSASVGARRRPGVRVPRPGRRHRRPLARRRRARAREAHPLQVHDRRRLGQPRHGRARRLQPRPPQGAAGARTRRAAAVRRGAAARRLHRPAVPARGHPRPPARPRRASAQEQRPGRGGGRGALRSFADLRTGDIVVHEDHGLARFAGFDTKTVAGVTRDYLNLEYAGHGQGLPARRPARQDQPLRHRGRRAPAAVQARRHALGDDQVARPPRRAGAGRRAAQPLRRAPPPPRPRLRPGPRGAARARGQVALPRDARPARGDRARQGRHGVRAPDGPADLRRRRLRQDRGRAARRRQGDGGGQAGADARPDDDPRPAALRHLHRAPARHRLRDRARQPLPPRRRAARRDQALQPRARSTA